MDYAKEYDRMVEQSNKQQEQLEQLRTTNAEQAERIKQLEAENEALLDSQIDKLMDLSDDQVDALCRAEGSNPDDSATIAKQAMQLAAANVRIAQLEDVLRVSRDALEDYYTLEPDNEASIAIAKINEVLKEGE